VIVRERVALAGYTTLGLGGPAARFLAGSSDEQVVSAVRAADQRGEPVLVLGGGSNLVIADAGFPGTVVRVATRGIRAARDGDRVVVSVAAGEDWDAVVSWCVSSGLSGIECLSGIPGLAGATPIQNVGAYGQDVAETIVAVRAYDRLRGVLAELSNADCGFGYRTSAFKRAAGLTAGAVGPAGDAAGPAGSAAWASAGAYGPTGGADEPTGDAAGPTGGAAWPSVGAAWPPAGADEPTGGAAWRTGGVGVAGDATGRFVVLGVTFLLAPDPLSAPVRYGELARALGAAEGGRVPLADAREAVLRLRRGKGMVLDPADPDTRSAGSFFTNPVLDREQLAALEHAVAAACGGDARVPRFPAGEGRVKVPAAWLIERAGFRKGYPGGGQPEPAGQPESGGRPSPGQPSPGQPEPGQHVAGQPEPGQSELGQHDSGPRISTKHTLALVNPGGATTASLLALARDIRNGVYEAFGVELVPEPVLVGAVL
jgi:UDP-N-acetylmuramate dehydrogenase